ncbi:MAG: HAMP domain-containing sensor histidine kinase, partial [Candidatus Delongbacteria bacterium]
DIDSSKCCLNEIIEDVLVIIKNSIKHSAEIRLELGQDIPPVECNYQEMAQILINLLTNARDAVDSKEDDTEQNIITISSGFDGERVYFEVSDNGIGMRDEDRERIFEPFYSTKSDGKGHGLGLYITKNIADNYNADINIESEYEKGTKFRVKFPINKTEEADDVERN